MNDKNLKLTEENSYQTGSTTPSKNRSGLIALLLAIIIVLGGLVSILSLLNIRLFHEILGARKEKSAVVFMEKTVSASTPATASEAVIPIIGFSGKDISSIDQLYYRIPAGVYISHVEDDSHALKKGILPGDILMKINGAKVTSTTAMNHALASHKTGDTISLTLYRDGKEFTVEIILK